MTDRHIVDDHATLVLRSLTGLVKAHPNLSLLPATKTVINADHDTSKVTLICGGGAGHEPGSTGFVGRGLLSASVSGDTFASPSARQVYRAINAVPSKEGTILIITNYTGDNLHFGLACQQARADGLTNVGILPVGDDVSVGRTKGALVGRRALAGTILVCKILGAASEASYSYSSTLNLGRATTAGLASIAATLGHCHVPGRSKEEFVRSQVVEGGIEIGLGLHNEPGVFVVNPRPSFSDLVARMMDLVLNQEDKERAFVPFNKSEDVLVLFVNNMGGMSVLEMYAVVDEAHLYLEKQGYNAPIRTICGTFMASLNAPGFSISLLNLTHVSKTFASVSSEAVSSATSTTSTNSKEVKSISVEGLLELIDAPHSSAAWPGGNIYPLSEHLQRRKMEERFIDEPEHHEEQVEKKDEPKVLVDPKVLQNVIREGAQAVFNGEPDLTRWDTIVGDGDCGETCANGAKAVLSALDEGLGSDGDLVQLFRKLTQIIDEACGGTLGAIVSIFLAALTAEVRSYATTSPNPQADMTMWATTTSRALQTLFQSTKAREGHRTVMDSLIPFVRALDSSSASSVPNGGTVLDGAVEACRKGGEGTQALVAKLGRATYVGESSEHGLPPDPGAMSLVFLVDGMKKGLLGA